MPRVPDHDRRYADLAQPPDPDREVRLRRDDCLVTIWLPADIRDVAAVMQALAELDFDFDRAQPRPEPLTEYPPEPADEPTETLEPDTREPGMTRWEPGE